MTSIPTPPSLPEHLYLRLSDYSLCLARYDADVHTAFAFSTYKMNPKISLAANLREAGRTEELFKEPGRDSVQVVVSAPATFVPLAEFQEEDCERIYDLCFPCGERRRVFYDVVAVANCVVLFSLKESTCHALEEALKNVNYVSSLTPLVRHFAAKGQIKAGQKRFFLYVHEQTADLVVFEDNRLLAANSYNVGSVADVSYFVLNVAQQLGAEIAPSKRADREEVTEAPVFSSEGYTAFFVAAEEKWRKEVCGELRKYAVNVRPINPGAEYNRHVVATTPNVPYDLMTLLLDFK